MSAGALASAMRHQQVVAAGAANCRENGSKTRYVLILAWLLLCLGLSSNSGGGGGGLVSPLIGNCHIF